MSDLVHEYLPIRLYTILRHAVCLQMAATVDYAFILSILVYVMCMII